MAGSRERAAACRALRQASRSAAALRRGGMDTADLDGRLAAAEGQLAADSYHDAQILAEEVIVVAKTLKGLLPPARRAGAARAPRTVTAEPSPRLRRALANEIKGQIKRLLESRKLAARIRRVAGEVAARALERDRKKIERTLQRVSGERADEACRSLAAELDLDGRLTGLLEGEALAGAIGRAIDEALAAVPDEARVQALAGEIVRKSLGGEELARVVREISAGLIKKTPPPSREEIETLAVERVRRELGARDILAGVESAARAAAGKALAASGLVTEAAARQIAGKLATESFPCYFTTVSAGLIAGFSQQVVKLLVQSYR